MKGIFQVLPTDYPYQNKIRKLIFEYVDDNYVSEIEMNGSNSLFLRKRQQRVEIKDFFDDEIDYTSCIKTLIATLDPKYKDQSIEEMELPSYLYENRMVTPRGTICRVHIVLPPVSDFPLVTIAIKSKNLTTIDDIFTSNAISLKMRDFLKAAIKTKLNIVFSGSSGSGKTTMLEALTREIPEDTRIGVAEDSPELALTQHNVVYLHTKPWYPSMDTNKVVSLDFCTRQINRMRTDLLIIGETRGSEFKEFITAANSGMEGSLTTIHANSPRMALNKMTQFIMEAQPQPIRVINQSIANTIDIIVQLHKTVDGEYKCLQIEEVSSVLGQNESANIATTPLTTFIPKENTWTDKFLMSDSLRSKFISHGYNTATFF